MRWMQSVGMVRWRRFGPDLIEILSGGVGSVCGMKRGISFSISQETPPVNNTNDLQRLRREKMQRWIQKTRLKYLEQLSITS